MDVTCNTWSFLLQNTKQNEATRPLTQAEIEEITKKLIIESDDESTHESGSESENTEEFEGFEDSAMMTAVTILRIFSLPG